MTVGEIIPWKRGKNALVSHINRDPFFSLFDQMNDLMESVVGERDFRPTKAWELSAQAFTPRVDVKDGPAEMVVKAELPGLEREHFDITLEKDCLILKGEKKDEFEKDEKEKGRYYAERRYGAFERVIPLTAVVKAEAVQAEFKNGILTVRLPKESPEKTGAKKISVK